VLTIKSRELAEPRVAVRESELPSWCRYARMDANTIQRTYRSVVNSTAKRDYRPDLRQVAVARASAIHNSQREKKDTPPAKPRGAKAKATAASS
jgi:hypothetical protein